MFVCLSVRMYFVCMCVCLFVCMYFVCMCVCLFLFMFVCLFVCLTLIYSQNLIESFEKEVLNVQWTNE